MPRAEKSEYELRYCSNIFRCAARSISCSFALRPVSGLASLDLPPSHKIPLPIYLGGDCSQWHTGKSALAYRCGGSTGIGLYPSPVSRLTRLLPDENLKAVRTLSQARCADPTGMVNMSSLMMKPARFPLSRLSPACVREGRGLAARVFVKTHTG